MPPLADASAPTVLPDGLVERARAIDAEAIGALAFELLSMWAPPGHETEVAVRLAAAFREVAGLDDVQLDEEFPGSPSIIAWLRGDEPGPTIQWHGHLDAIDVPHAPARREGDTLHGRGACDMRAACAALVWAAKALRESGLPRRGNVLITLHGLHESGGNEPLHRLIERGIHGDAAISGEVGGGLTLPVASLGLTFWSIVVKRPGGSLHETNAAPDLLRPLAVGRLLLERLDRLNERLAAHTHPYVGAESVYVGKFTCGDYFNTVPERCELAGTRRHGPGTSLAAVRDELEGLVEAVRHETGADIETHWNSIAEAFSLDPSESIVAAIREANIAVTGHDLSLVGMRASGNAVHFQQEARIPAVYYGADYSTAHSDHESVSVSDLARIAGGYALASALYLEGAPRT
ncbi:MAG: M20/M25/M40 family metallo-hydrolase [Chloroflexi bacterium]|nr:M20/M25/M40 family metallo-hydrolase [Chloroflexota bacterium]